MLLNGSTCLFLVKIFSCIFFFFFILFIYLFFYFYFFFIFVLFFFFFFFFFIKRTFEMHITHSKYFKKKVDVHAYIPVCVCVEGEGAEITLT